MPYSKEGKFEDLFGTIAHMLEDNYSLAVLLVCPAVSF